MKKINWVLATAVVIIIAVIGGYLIVHKSPSPKTNNSSTTASTSTNSTSSNQINNSILVTKNNSSVGNYLADPNGNTLYTDGSGSTGVDDCTGSCLSAWQAYIDKGSTTGLPANVGTIKRSDNGEIQYTYKDMPLYYFSSDSQGQVTGNGVSGFSVAKP